MFSTFDGIRAALAELPSFDKAAADAAAARNGQLTKPAGSLGRLEDIAIRSSPAITAWRPSVSRPFPPR